MIHESHENNPLSVLWIVRFPRLFNSRSLQAQKTGAAFFQDRAGLG
jgi:hypothetical protein